jgi:hypothetical protein
MNSVPVVITELPDPNARLKINIPFSGGLNTESGKNLAVAAIVDYLVATRVAVGGGVGVFWPEVSGSRQDRYQALVRVAVAVVHETPGRYEAGVPIYGAGGYSSPAPDVRTYDLPLGAAFSLTPTITPVDPLGDEGFSEPRESFNFDAGVYADGGSLLSYSVYHFRSPEGWVQLAEFTV